MKKKISIILLSLSTVLTGTALSGNLFVFAENADMEQTENIFREASKGEIKLGKITAVSDDTVSVALAEKPEKQEKFMGEKPAELLIGEMDENEPPEEPELTLSGETVTVNVTESVRIRTDSSEAADISSLSVGDTVMLIYNEDDELIEISSGKLGGHRGMFKDGMTENKNCRLGKITAVSDDTVSVALAEKPEKQEKFMGEKPAEFLTGEMDENEPPEEPELTLSGETVAVNVTESVRIRTDSSEAADISSLSVGDTVMLVYNEDDELIEISSGKLGGHRGMFKDRMTENKNCRLGKITAVSDDTVSVALAEKPEKQEKFMGEKPAELPTGEVDENEPPEEPELTLSGETVTVTVNDAVSIKTDFSEASDISSLSVGDTVNLIYSDDNEIIEICLHKFDGYGKGKELKKFEQQKDFKNKEKNEIADE